ncbi:glycosyltransferase [Fontimonas sp. SYSU GA230001]|uniref:glycosyltransferase family 2 protein n=1 Tax=Fontimonas sp. SYSU GA230001 TaxID=3142450 RepID=UPI0032B34207
MSIPDVSICIMTFNQSRYIRRCVESVLEETLELRAEIIVGDDLSTDDTPAIVESLRIQYPGRLQYVRHPQRLGASQNTRALLDKARADLIARVDGDDYWLPGKLRRQLAFLQRHPDCSAVYTNAVTIDEQGHELGLFNNVGDETMDLDSLLRRGNFLCNSSVLFRSMHKQQWLSIEGDLIDYRAHLLHAQNGPIGHIGEPLVAYRVNAVGSLVNEANARVRELYWDAILSVPRDKVSQRAFAEGLADFWRRVALRSIRERRPDLLRRWTPAVLSASPYPASVTLAFCAFAFGRAVVSELAGRATTLVSSDRPHILYRR